MAWPAIAARLAAFFTSKPEVGQAVSSAISGSRAKLAQQGGDVVSNFFKGNSKKKGTDDEEVDKINRRLALKEAAKKKREWDSLDSFGKVRKSLEDPKFLASESGMKGAIGKGIQGMQGERFGDIAGGAFGAADKMGLPFAKLGEELSRSVDKLRDWNEHLHDSNMQFAEFSGAMANVQAEQLQRDIALGRERGERRAESARYLAEGKSEFNQNFTGFEDAAANIKNWATGFFDKALAKITTPLGYIGDRLAELTSGTAKNSEEMFLEEGFKDMWTERYGKPPRFPK